MAGSGGSLAPDRLGTPAMVYISMCAAAVLTVVAGAVPAAYAATSFVSIPAAYVVAAVVLLLFASGFVAGSRHVRSSGPYYAVISVGLGRIVGAGAAAVAVVSYGLMTVGLLGGFGAAVALASGGSVPWWLASLGGAVLIGGLGLLRVELSGRVLAAVMLAEAVAVVAMDAVLLAHPAGGRWEVSPWVPAGLLVGGPVLVMGSIGSYVGFELAAVFAAEARHPARTVARAVRVSILGMAVVYAVSAWALPVATGVGAIHAAAQLHGLGLMFDLAAPYVGVAVASGAQVLLLTSMFGAAAAFHNTLARYLFALGRDGVLAGWVGFANRWQAPAAGSVLTSVVTVVAVGVAGWVGADPVVHLLLWLTVAGGFGLVWLMAATSIAVLVMFARRPRHAWVETVWQRRIAPTGAAVVLVLLGSASIPEFQYLIGVPAASGWRWVIPSVFGMVAVAGLGWGWVLHRRRTRHRRAEPIGWGGHGMPETATGAVSEPVA